MRVIGSASLDLCLVASGRLTGFWHDGLYPWGVAAGLIIIQEAGGKISDRDGNEFKFKEHKDDAKKYFPERHFCFCYRNKNRFVEL
ncbi:inositol monophosphatase family protein [Paenibacillus sp. 2TAB26]|uniref:inositol monophosphatase family protein n=1 Tax=Paenibacillus sp. 2TAB26 TaxID=3233005 RepID=UPI003F997171